MSVLDRFAGSAGTAAAKGSWLARGAWLLAVAEVLVAVREHLSNRLSDRDRKRLVEIVRTSHGRPSNLDDGERRELRRLIGKIEPAELAKTVAQSGLAGRFSRRRR